MKMICPENLKQQSSTSFIICIKTNMTKLVEAKDSMEGHSYKMIPQNWNSMQKNLQSVGERNIYHLNIRWTDQQKYEIRLIQETANQQYYQIVRVKNVLQTNLNLIQSQNIEQIPFDELQSDKIFPPNDRSEKEKQILQQKYQHIPLPIDNQQSEKIINPQSQFRQKEQQDQQHYIIDTNNKIPPFEGYLQSIEYLPQNDSFQQNQNQQISKLLNPNFHAEEVKDSGKEIFMDDNHPFKQYIAFLGDSFSPNGVMINYSIEIVEMQHQRLFSQHQFSHEQSFCSNQSLDINESNHYRINQSSQMNQIDDQNNNINSPIFYNPSIANLNQDSNNQSQFNLQQKNINSLLLYIENNNDLNLPRVRIIFYQHWDLFKQKWKIVNNHQKVSVTISEETTSITLQSKGPINSDIQIQKNSSDKGYRQLLLFCHEDQFYQILYQQANLLNNQTISQEKTIPLDLHLKLNVSANTITLHNKQKYIRQKE